MGRIKNLFHFVSKMGFGWTAFRIGYEFKRKTGILKSYFPAGSITDLEIDDISTINFNKNTREVIPKQLGKFLFATDDLFRIGTELNKILDITERERLVSIADNAIEGKIYGFGHSYFDYGNPINWHYNPVDKLNSPVDIHWSEIDDLSDRFGDIKYIWEASRFSQVYFFVRAYSITKDIKYAEAFWEQIEHWIQYNPLELGVNWKCGQEISIRTMAWIFGLQAFWNAACTTDARLCLLLKYIYYNTLHIEKNYVFALKSVKNNHSISEAAGMYTVGLLFPFFKDSARWLKKGKLFLEKEGLWQIYDDGTYMQHSMNYHRLIIQVYSMCIRLGELNNLKFDHRLTEKLSKSLEFLYQTQDAESGRLPNYGSNDGALLYPMSSCDYLDYRPQLNILNYILHHSRLYPSGLHDEGLIWFCGMESLSHKIVPKDKGMSEFINGGYYVMRNENCFGLIRCANYKHRPHQADMLHFDLWYKGTNILSDAGTFSYNTDTRYNNYFIGTESHNTLKVDGKSQMQKLSRFMWSNWTRSNLINFTDFQEYQYFEGEHYGYKPLTHRRSVIFGLNYWIVVDDVFGEDTKDHCASISWLVSKEVSRIKDRQFIIHSGKDRIGMDIFSSSKIQGIDCYYGNEEIPAGWQSLYYSSKEPVYQVICNTDGKLPLRLITIVYDMEDGIDININSEYSRVCITQKNNKPCCFALRPPGRNDTVRITEC